MKAIILFLVFLGATMAWAQQDPQFTQYFDNLQNVNPAYTATGDVLTVKALHREQWAGFAGRPRSTSLTLQSPTKYESVHIGATVMNDVIGPIHDVNAAIDFAYRVRFQGARQLILGLKMGGGLMNVSTSTLQTTTEQDPGLMQMTNNELRGNIGFGAMYTSNNWMAGFSMPRLLEQSYRAFYPDAQHQRHFYFLGGKVFDLARLWKLRSMGQVRLTTGAPMGLDVSSTLIFDNRLYFGAMYRLDAAFGAFVQMNVHPDIRVGLGTEFGTQDIRSHNFGTFELMLTYECPKNKSVRRSPRYF